MIGEPVLISSEQFAALLAEAFLNKTMARPQQAFSVGSMVRLETDHGQVFRLDVTEVK